jgi:hypothetical protein
LDITARWKNEGVAPPAIYPHYQIEWQLRRGSSVVWTKASTYDIHTLLPTENYAWSQVGTPPYTGGGFDAGSYTGTGYISHTDSYSLPTGLAPGTYGLAVRVRDLTNVRHMRLAITTARNTDGSYTLGNLTWL